MVFSPNFLKAQMSLLGEPARPCHYVCMITPPAGMLAGGLLGGIGTFLSIAGAINVSMLAEACSIPGKQIATTPFTMYGTTMKMPYGTLYDDFVVTFICSKSMVERTFFDTWASFIHNPHNNYMHYLDEYIGTIVVVKLNDVSKPGIPDAANILSVWMLQDCFPVTIQAQELSYASEDYLRLTVQFAYRKYVCGVDSFISPILPGGITPGVPSLSQYLPIAISAATQVLTPALNALGLNSDDKQFRNNARTIFDGAENALPDPNIPRPPSPDQPFLPSPKKAIPPANEDPENRRDVPFLPNVGKVKLR